MEASDGGLKENKTKHKRNEKMMAVKRHYISTDATQKIRLCSRTPSGRPMVLTLQSMQRSPRVFNDSAEITR